MASDKPTIVLVHGAWGDGTGFDAQIRALRKQGFSVIAPPNHLRGVGGDAANVAALLQSLDGPIVLCGHSYGGMVIGNAATASDNVRALVFFNGWMPDEGEAIGALLGREEAKSSLVPQALVEVPFKNPDGTEGVDLYLDRDKFREVFAGDVDEETAEVMAAAQRPWSAGAASEPAQSAAWRSLPSWYLLGTDDRAIPPDLQRYMAERAPQCEIVEIASSHASMVSQPQAATDIVLRAVNSLSLATA